jgi:hypothetical protein
MKNTTDELESILHLNGCQQYTRGWNDAKDGKDIDTDKIEELEKATLEEAQALITKEKNALLDRLLEQAVTYSWDYDPSVVAVPVEAIQAEREL